MTLENYLAQHPKKYLIFDLDGTLARLNIDWSNVHRDLFAYIATFDEPLTKTVSSSYFAGVELSNKAAKKHGKEVATKIREFVEEYEISHYMDYTPNPELLSFIRKNSQTYTYYLWTGNGRKTIQDFLTKEQLSPFFPKIVTQNDVALIKPDPEGFSLLYTKDEPLSFYLLVGDTVNDEGAAKNAGIDFFQVDYFVSH